MNPSETLSGPNAPLSSLGENGQAYIQTHPGGHGTLWSKSGGAWTIAGNVGGSSGGSAASFLSANVTRVDPSGDDSTGTVGDLGKPFLTVQGAIDALEALDPAPNFPFIDIGNNNYFNQDVSTSLNTLGFVGRASCAIPFIPFHSGGLPGQDVANAPFGTLTCNAETGDTSIILKDCHEAELITGNPAGSLAVQLSNATLDQIVSNAQSINVDGGGNSNLEFIQGPDGGNVNVANLASAILYVTCTNGEVTVSNCVLGDVTCSDLELYNCITTGSLTTDQTNIHPDLTPPLIFPDSDPHIAGAGYWVDGVLTKSLG